MAHKYREREEIVGKRFLCIINNSNNSNNNSKLKKNKISEWLWKRGTVRASTHRDINNSELNILVEFDDVDWKKREWIRVYEQNAFQVFLIEYTLVWINNKETPIGKNILWPCLNFKTLIDKIGFEAYKLKPIEFLVDKHLEFVDYSQLTVFQTHIDLENQKAYIESPEVRKTIRKWTEFQDSQRIVLTTPSVLVGYRVKVYRSEGTTQWYTAVIVSYNENTRELTLTDDTVLEEHNEDPSLVQMKLIGDGVVESILRGEDIGITPRRRTCTQNPTLLQSHKSKKSSNQQKYKSESKREVNTNNNNSENRNSYRHHISRISDINAEKSKESINSSSDTEIEDSQKTSHQQKRKNRAKRNRKKSSESDAASSDDRDRSQSQSSPDSVPISDAYNSNPDFKLGQSSSDVNKVNSIESKRLNNKLNQIDSNDNNNKLNEFKLNTDSVQVSDSSFTPTCSVISSVKSEQILNKSNTLSSESTKITNLTDNIPVITDSTPKTESKSESFQLKDKKSQQNNNKCNDCNAPQMVPTMCSLDEQLSTNQANDSKSQSFASNQNVINCENKVQENNSLKPNSNTNITNNNNNISLNDSKSNNLSLALDRTESVTVYRDPNLANKQIIRHIESLQHIQHGLMHSVTSTTASSIATPPEYSRIAPTSQARTCQPTILPPSSAPSMSQQFKMKSQSMHSHPSQSHIMNAGSHAHSNSVDPQIYRHLMQTHPMVSGYSAPPIDMLWQQKSYPHLASIPPSASWGAYNEQMRAQILHHENDKQQGIRIERERREEKQNKIENKELMEKERARQEEKARERKQREAVEQHFEESLRLAQQKKSQGWSVISNLPLNTKSQTNISRQSHVLPQQQQQQQQQQQASHLQSMKSNISFNSRDFEFSKEQEQERWMAYMHQQQSQHSQPHHPHHSQMSSHDSIAKQKASELGHYQSSVLNGPSNKGSNIVHQINTSPMMDTSKHHQMTSRAKNEPSFSLYGYQPNHNISYITPAQLKENNRLNVSSGVSSIGPMMSSNMQSNKVPPAAHGFEKRESPKIDRSLTPSSRNSTPIGRPPSLSPKQKSPKMMVQERISPLYHRSQSVSIKQNDYSQTNAPPAHQNSSSRSNTPHLSNPSIPIQLQSQIPVAHSSTQEQPQNLVKSDIKSKPNYNEMSKQQMEIHRNSPNTNLHSRSANMSTGYSQAFSLIQQGLVPNPLYTVSSTTQSTTNTSSMPSVISKPQSKTSNTTLSQSQQSPHLFTRPGPGPGIMSGIPICRPNSIHYYTELPQRNPSVLSSQTKKESSNTYPDLSRGGKAQTHVQYNTTPDRNVQLFHRPPSSPHSPRIATGSVPQSPYGPAPGMVPVNTSLTNHSHPTPPAAHSGVHPFNLSNSNVKRKSVDSVNIPLNKKQRITDSPVSHSTNAKSGENVTKISNSATNVAQDSTEVEVSEVSRDRELPTNAIPSKDINENASQISVNSEEFIPKHQKAISVASRGLNSSNHNPVEQKPSEDTNPKSTKSVNSSTASVSSNSSSSSTTSSFHPKLKKAWLQRHSDEDKVGVSGNTTSNNNTTLVSGNSSPAKTPSESSSKSVDNIKDNNDSKTGDLVVNGDIVKTEIKEEELSGTDETSSASEAEVSAASKGGKRKCQSRGVKTRKRGSIQLKEKESKKRKSNQDNSKSDESLKIGKENEEKKKKEKSKDSDKESSDIRSTTRRGRKPKPKIQNEDKEKLKESSSSLKKRLPKGKSDRTAMAELKKSGAHFLQGGSCVEVAPKLPKCRECRMTPTQRNRKPTIFCRFYDYRKLAFKSNILTIAGFSQPQDASDEDLKLWLPSEEPLTDLDIETAKFLIAHVGDQFCDLVKQEKEAQLLHMGSSNKNITWKKVVQGVREMCDVCETTLFNIHWVCDKCGFVVCIDCYKARKVGSIKEESCPAKDRDGFQWLLCNNRQQHEPQKLEVTQIIAASALSNVGRMLHTLRNKWNIASNCSCVSVAVKDVHKKSNGFTKQVLSVVKIENKQLNGVNETSNKNWKSINGTVAIIKQETDSTLTGYSSESGNSPLSFFVDVALTSEKLISKSPIIKEENELKSKKKGIKVEKDSELIDDMKDDEDNKHSTLRELLMGPTSKSTKDSKSNGSPINESQTTQNKKSNQLSDVESKEDLKIKDENQETKEPMIELQHFTRRYVPLRKEAEPLPIISRAVEETKKLYPHVPHHWYCNGKLLVLHEPKNVENIHIFQEQWIRGQPVIVKENHKNLSQNLWHPESFSRDFGDIKNDLVNCRNGDTLSKQPMRKFWDGFESLSNRMKDKNGEHMLLKLKDWPPDEEFSELLPQRYRDLMNSLPLPEYTNRNGVLNLASRLPDCFVRPDLGPKMYSAYGSTLYPDKGTTNLHLDISDAVNVMIFVGIAKENNKSDKDLLQDVLNSVDSGGCDELMKKRVREKGVKVGALWHIYNARDADKIRDLLNKVAVERGETLEPHHDPIHDQSWYLDDSLRDRLLKEYGVEGYAIAQCLGDAIFIPAGAPHQVRNLNSCIKVAGDFVSPENVSHCFNLTQEFRQLSDTHTNHEDKLQIKNIIYHAVKDALSCLRNHSQDSD